MTLRMISTAIVTTLIFTGCTTPSTLTYDKSKLTLKVENRHLQVHGSVVKSNTENFGILYLDQKLLRLDDGSLVMYEYGETDMSYEFANTTQYTIDNVFDVVQSIEVFEQSLFFAYQLVLSDRRILNVVVSQGYDQEITMVYGMSSEKLDKMIHKLDPLAKPVPYRNAINVAYEPNPLLSRWTTYKVNFIPLVQLLPRMMRI